MDRNIVYICLFHDSFWLKKNLKDIGVDVRSKFYDGRFQEKKMLLLLSSRGFLFMETMFMVCLFLHFCLFVCLFVCLYFV